MMRFSHWKMVRLNNYIKRIGKLKSCHNFRNFICLNLKSRPISLILPNRRYLASCESNRLKTKRRWHCKINITQQRKTRNSISNIWTNSRVLTIKNNNWSHTWSTLVNIDGKLRAWIRVRSNPPRVKNRRRAIAHCQLMSQPISTNGWRCELMNTRAFWDPRICMIWLKSRRHHNNRANSKTTG